MRTECMDSGTGGELMYKELTWIHITGILYDHLETGLLYSLDLG